MIHGYGLCESVFYNESAEMYREVTPPNCECADTGPPVYLPIAGDFIIQARPGSPAVHAS